MMARIHLIIFTLIHFFFSIYVRLRRAYHAITNRMLTVLYYHHRTPELIKKDVHKLERVPKHLSAIVRLQEDGDGVTGLESLMNDVSEIAAWCAAAQIPTLSVYEKTGKNVTQSPSGYFVLYSMLMDMILLRRLETLPSTNPPSHLPQPPSVLWPAAGASLAFTSSTTIAGLLTTYHPAWSVPRSRSVPSQRSLDL